MPALEVIRYEFFSLWLHANSYIDGASTNFGYHSSLETYFPAYWLQILTAFSTE
jgi:hypothetical protein